MSLDPAVLAPPNEYPAPQLADLGRRVGRLEAQAGTIGAGSIIGPNNPAGSPSHIYALSITGASVQAGSLQADRVTTGVLSAALITLGSGGQLMAGVASAARVTYDSTGIKAYNGSNVQTLNIDAASGSVTITGGSLVAGSIRTANSPLARVEITSAGLYAYDSGNVEKFRFDTATGSLSLTGVIVAQSTSQIPVTYVTSGNIVSGTVITITSGGYLQTSSTNPRVVLDNAGLRAYNASGVLKADINATLASFTGATFQTATSGARVVLDSSGLRAYDTDGTTEKVNIAGATATITGATIRTAANGARVEITSTGVVQYLSNGTSKGVEISPTGGLILRAYDLQDNDINWLHTDGTEKGQVSVSFNPTGGVGGVASGSLLAENQSGVNSYGFATIRTRRADSSSQAGIEMVNNRATASNVERSTVRLLATSDGLSQDTQVQLVGTNLNGNGIWRLGYNCKLEGGGGPDAGWGDGIATNTHIRFIGGTTPLVYNPPSDTASVSLSWNANVARLRYGGTGTGSAGGFSIQKAGDVQIAGFGDSGAFVISGSVATKATGTTWANPSDVLLKRNVESYKVGLDVVRNLRPISYELTGRGGLPRGATGIGLLAQDLFVTAPFMVEPSNLPMPGDVPDEPSYTVDTSALPWLLVNSVQEHDREIEALRVAVDGIYEAANPSLLKALQRLDERLTKLEKAK